MNWIKTVETVHAPSLQILRFLRINFVESSISAWEKYALKFHRDIPFELAGADVDDLHLNIFLGDAGAYFIFFWKTDTIWNVICTFVPE